MIGMDIAYLGVYGQQLQQRNLHALGAIEYQVIKIQPSVQRRLRRRRVLQIASELLVLVWAFVGHPSGNDVQASFSLTSQSLTTLLIPHTLCSTARPL
jgi:hypothetical protein